jgi:hypothetical protein
MSFGNGEIRMDQSTLEKTQDSSPGKIDESRREIRFSCNTTPIKVYFDGDRLPVEAQLLEVSKSGLSFLIGDPVPVRALIRIDLGDFMVEGDVRHCEPCANRQSGYRVGILIRVAGAAQFGTLLPRTNIQRDFLAFAACWQANRSLNREKEAL